MTTPTPGQPETQSRFRLGRIIALTLFPAIAGVGLAQLLVNMGIVSSGKLSSGTIATLMLFAAQDRSGGLVFGALVLGALMIAPRTRLAAWLEIREPAARRLVTLLALGGGVLTWLTACLAFEGYGLSLDEYLPQFQAEILRKGRLLAPLPPDMVPYHMWLQPFFAYTDEARGLWGSHYRPGHAILLALMPSLGGINVLNSILTVLSVWAIAAIARRLWPTRPEMPVLGALLFLTSPQVLVTAGTGFAYPAHLAFNLIWLALFLKGAFEARVGPHLAAAAIGAFAIGLHQVHVHPLFALPFLMLLVLGTVGRRIHLLPYVVLYLVALPIWVMWPELAVWVSTGDASALPRRLIDVDYLADFLRYNGAVEDREAPLRPMYLIVNLLRYLLWLSPAVILLVVVALGAPRRMGLIAWAAVASILLTVVANHVLMANQMQTWGTRYYHPIIGSMIVLAMAGYARLREASDDSGAGRLAETTVLLLLASALVLVPQRLAQVHAKVAPRAAVQRAIEAIDADVVMVPVLSITFHYDLVRNSPFLTNRPLILALPPNTPEPLIDALPENLRGARVHILTMQDLITFGLPRGTLYEPGEPLQ
ncbi:hypothetical protein [Paenirhodobacter enshiensis]|uniref:hypothetical protein n=1 Tax=Paenirhodobacter enshiensis TaxID=1105367 RepID=UPI003FA2C303